MRVLIVVLPVALSFVFSWWLGRTLPPHRVGLATWQWWIAMLVVSGVLFRLLGRLFRRLTPLAALLQVTLIFPDQAPSRMRTALRSGNGRTLVRELQDAQAAGVDAHAPVEILLAMLGELKSHDPLTRGHSERVRAYTDLIAEQMGLEGEDADKLRWGALLHDVGKLEVPAEILAGKGRPTDEEWKILQTHPAHSGLMLAPLRDWLGDWVLAGEQHHERWDGAGYPNKLSGEEISLAGRIVAVADAYDVMTSVRSYKKALDPADARTELARCAGGQFDPVVVRAFLEVGVGRLRAVLGPLGWFAGVLDALRIPVAPAAIANATVSATAAAVVTLGAAAGVTDEPAEPVPAVEREVAVDEAKADPEEPAPEVAMQIGDLEIVVDEDDEVEFLLRVTDDERITAVLGDVGSGSASGGTILRTSDDQWGVAVRYTPPVDFVGDDTVEVEVCSVEGDCRVVTVVVKVTEVNDRPRPVDDEVSVESGSSVVADVLANDVDVDGPELAVVLGAQPVNGSATTDGTVIVYTPAEGFVGVDSLDYLVVDGAGGEAPARLDVVVTAPAAPTTSAAPPPSTVGPSSPTPPPATVPPTTAPPLIVAPTAAADVAAANEDSGVVIDVLANDVAGSAPLGTEVLVQAAPTSGSVVVGAEGEVTYTPFDDANGSDTFTYRVRDTAGRLSNEASVTVVVAAVNDEPGFVPGGSVRVDVGAVVDQVWATEVTPGPVDESSQTVGWSVLTVNAGLFTSVPTLDASGRLRFVAGPTGGFATIYVQLNDSGGTARGGDDTSPTEVFVVTVNGPPVAGDDSAVVVEDGSVVIDVLADDTDAEDGTPAGAVTITSGPAHGSAVVNPDRTVTYTPDPESVTADGFTYEVADADGLTSNDADVTITVTGVNDAPSFVDGGDPGVVLEDAGAQTVAGWASSISAGPASESGQVLSFSVTGNTNPGLFAAGPVVDEVSGDLTYTPVADASGSADITVELADDGGTANGGVDTSAPVTFTITVTGVNDAPTFVDGGDPGVVLEDAGAQTVAGWASSISAGPASESGQVLSFSVTGNTNPGLFAAGPVVDEVSGDLTYTPVADASGSADITVELADDGGTANGGVDTSAPVTFTITVDPVNDAPTFVDGGSTVGLDTLGAHVVAGWASSIDAGAADESGQILTFSVTGNTNPGLFAVGPAVDAGTGDLTFTTIPGTTGSADVTVVLTDDGGTAGGGVDTSAPVTFTITVGGVNDAPSFVGGGDPAAVLEDAGAQTVVGWASAMSSGPPDESGQSLTFVVTGNTNPGLFAAGPAVDEASGDLTFTPAADANGSADITLVLADDGGTLGGGQDTSAPVTFTIVVDAVNDAPSFTDAGDPAPVLEGAGAQTVDGLGVVDLAGPGRRVAPEPGLRGDRQHQPGSVRGGSGGRCGERRPDVHAGGGRERDGGHHRGAGR